ncbi:Transcriptional regulatory protein FixJ [Burkholderiales bacterium]|jgi:RNA polymerase sigma factor (sigma-70 family)|nr:Transcriptional regulatory protein FixJ [Burkholderiales bacterium]
MYRPVVYIVDDDPAVRKSLALWLGFRSLATRDFDSAEPFLAAVDTSCQGCAIVDVRLGGMDGLELQKRLAERQIQLPLLFLTGHGDVPTARAALKAGAFDFLEKPVDNDRLIELVAAALAKDEERWQSVIQAERMHERVARLTAREREVMEQVVAGRHNREIALQMGISARTVEVYKARLMDKLDVRRIADLIRFAMKSEIATPSSASPEGPPSEHDQKTAR